MRTTSIILAGLIVSVAGTAVADSKIEVLDRGNAVEVIAHDVKALKTDITTVRSRLEVPVVGTPVMQGTPSNDKTVKVIELTGHGAQKNLSVKLAFEHEGVVELAKQAQAIQVGNDLHIIVPRVAGVVDMPEPTLSPELAAKAAAIAPVISTPAVIPPPPPVKEEIEHETPKVEPQTAPVVDTKVAAKVEEKKSEEKPAQKAEDKKPIAGAQEPSPMKSFPMMLALVLACVGCFAWMKRKKAKPAEKGSSIEVIAQKSLGGKAKIVWLQAGGRDIVVAVTPTSVSTLGNWKKSANQNAEVGPLTAALPEMTALGIAPTEKSEKTKSNSPAVAGLLKLRQRTNVPAVNEEVATDDSDADAIWAKEILAATGARR